MSIAWLILDLGKKRKGNFIYILGNKEWYIGAYIHSTNAQLRANKTKIFLWLLVEKWSQGCFSFQSSISAREKPK